MAASSSSHDDSGVPLLSDDLVEFFGELGLAARWSVDVLSISGFFLVISVSRWMDIYRIIGGGETKTMPIVYIWRNVGTLRHVSLVPGLKP